MTDKCRGRSDKQHQDGRTEPNQRATEEAGPKLGVVHHPFPHVHRGRELQKRNECSRPEYIDIGFKRVADSPEERNHHPN
jgi:hypothetical protein